MVYNSEYTFEVLLYDQRARKQFFDDLDKLIKWCKDFGYFQTALDHAATRSAIREKLEMLD